jgi:hypothetical protein
MFTLAYRIIFVSLVATFGFTGTASAATDDIPSHISTVNIGQVMRQFKIREHPSTLIRVTADALASKVAFLFIKPNGQYKVYVNDKVFDAGTLKNVRTPILFRFTADGQLLHAVQPTVLMIGRKILSGTDNTFSYDIGTDSVYEHAGRIYYAETHRVRMYDTKSKYTETLHEHEGTIVYLRGHGQSLFYAVKEGGQTYLYNNGRKLIESPISNPHTFFVTSSGKVAYFIANGDNYTLYLNTEPYMTGKGFGGFIFEDTRGNLWHIAGEGDPADPKTYSVTLYKNKERQDTPPLSNMEGAIAFYKDQYATRASKQGSALFQLLKNGKLIGTPFAFDAQRDVLGVQFDAKGTTYMRNSIDNRWRLLVDGKDLLPNTFKNVWFFDQKDGRMRVYGSEF